MIFGMSAKHAAGTGKQDGQHRALTCTRLMAGRPRPPGGPNSAQAPLPQRAQALPHPQGPERLSVTYGVLGGGGGVPPGRGALREKLPLGSLGHLASSKGVPQVLPPGQGGAQQAEGLPRARGALQDAVHFLDGDEQVEEEAGAQAGPRSPRGPAERTGSGPGHGRAPQAARGAPAPSRCQGPAERTGSGPGHGGAHTPPQSRVSQPCPKPSGICRLMPVAR